MTDSDKERVRVAKDLVYRAVAKFIDSVTLSLELAAAVEAKREFAKLLAAALIDLAASNLAATTSMPAEVAEQEFGKMFRYFREHKRPRRGPRAQSYRQQN
jgi:hypothetical protein